MWLDLDTPPMCDQDCSATNYSEAQNCFIMKIKIIIPVLTVLFWTFAVTKNCHKNCLA